MTAMAREVEPDVDWVVVQRLMDGQTVPASPAERAEAAVQLRRQGLSSKRIAERLGRHERQIQRWLAPSRRETPSLGARPAERHDDHAPAAAERDEPTPHVVRIGVDRLRFHPRNVRNDLGDLRSLTASITAHGVLCPLMAHRHGTHLQLLHGHRRLAAARLAGLRTVPVLIVQPHDDDEAIALMLAENLQRAGLRHTERHTAIRALLEEFGHTTSGLARRLGTSPDTVRRWAAGDEPRRPRPARRRRIPASTLLALADTWTDRAAAGLTAQQATQLLDQLRQLGAGHPDQPEEPTQ